MSQCTGSLATQVLSCTLRMMDNRLKYLGLRRNNLGHTTFALLRSLMNQTPRLQIVDVRDNRDPAVDVLRAPAHKACAIHHSTQVSGRPPLYAHALRCQDVTV